MRGRLGASVAVAVGIAAFAVQPLLGWEDPAFAGPGFAAATTSCGPAAQPCTWNFQPQSGADVYRAQAPGSEGSGALVAVVDTWVDFAHPDFGGRVVDEADCIGGTCKDRTYSPDACVHGTHVAGTIASSTYGVAPKASILSVQVLAYTSNGECSGSTADVAAGIEFAAAHGAKVINLSLGDILPGLFQDSAVTTAVHDAAVAGSLVVFAAGNSSLPLTDNYGSDALLIAATGPGGGIASYSDFGGSVALAAPGGDDGAAGLNGCDASRCILSTEPHNSYGLLEGTSMAAPHVSGTAALLLAENPRRGRADIVHALESTAKPLAGAGSGALDAGAALGLEPPAPASASPTATTSPNATGRAVTGNAAQSAGSPATATGGPSRGGTAVSGQNAATAGASGGPGAAGGPGSTTSPNAAPPSATPVPGTPISNFAPHSAAAPGGHPGKKSSTALAGAIAGVMLLITGAGAGAALVTAWVRRRG